jgi:hypothetical protein
MGTDPARRVINVGVCLAAVLVFLQAACQAIDFGLFHLDLRILDSNHHKSVFGAASVLAQTAAAAAIILRATRPSRVRLARMLLGALVAILVYVRAFVDYDVAMLLGPVAVLFALICWLAWRDPPIVRIIVLGSLALLVCSFALHAVGPAADVGPGHVDGSWAFQLTAMLKHGAELAGWILLATGMLAGGVASRRTSSRSANSLFWRGRRVDNCGVGGDGDVGLG